MAASAAATDDRRSRLYAALVRRNRFVAALRIGVPAAGAALFAVLAVQIVLDNLRDQFGFADIRFDRDNLVVDTPQLTAVGDDGTRYSVTATSARVAITATDLVDLVDAVFAMTPPAGGASLTATAAAAELQTTAQHLTVEDVMHVASSDGMTGSLHAVFADLLAFTMVARGPVDMRFSDGTELAAESMSYDGATQLWNFKRATLTLQSTPGEVP